MVCRSTDQEEMMSGGSAIRGVGSGRPMGERERGRVGAAPTPSRSTAQRARGSSRSLAMGRGTTRHVGPSRCGASRPNRWRRRTRRITSRTRPHLACERAPQRRGRRRDPGRGAAETAGPARRVLAPSSSRTLAGSPGRPVTAAGLDWRPASVDGSLDCARSRPAVARVPKTGGSSTRR